MRKYIRHPSDIPIEIDPQDDHHLATQNLRDVSFGGLSFCSREAIELGKLIKVRIGFVSPPFETMAKVVWCKGGDNEFEIGMELMEEEAAFKTRMVEQVCHIEHYKRQVLKTEGRQLTGAEAAMEWISKYAASFPQIHEAETS